MVQSSRSSATMVLAGGDLNKAATTPSVFLPGKS